MIHEIDNDDITILTTAGKADRGVVTAEYFPRVIPTSHLIWLSSMVVLIRKTNLIRLGV